MYKDMITKEIMQKCIDQGMTQTEMAVRLDTSFETIHRLLKQYDLKPAYNHDTGKYDEEKMAKGSGVALILIGILTGIDSYVKGGMVAEIVYVSLILVIMIGLGLYLKFKCVKKK